jgi:CRISPR/Cas system-associated exonuclease Cas4 (RecB family)
MIRTLQKIRPLVLTLFFIILITSAQETSVTLVPDMEYYYFDSEGPPSFSLGADPNAVICIELATEKKILINVDNQTDKNFFSSYYGNNSIGGEEIKTDSKGEASYELPKEAWEALVKGKFIVRLYYRAYVIEPSYDENIEDTIKWGTLSVRNWEDAPYVEVFKSKKVAEGYDLMQNAKKYVDEEDYAKAATEYFEAYKSWPNLDFVYNMATCYMHAAAESYDNYIDLGITGNEITSQERKDVEDLIKKIRNLIPEIR